MAAFSSPPSLLDRLSPRCAGDMSPKGAIGRYTMVPRWRELPSYCSGLPIVADLANFPGGQSRQCPADVWAGSNLLIATRIAGVVIRWPPPLPIIRCDGTDPSRLRHCALD